jgi:hypothetical protein
MRAYAYGRLYGFNLNTTSQLQRLADIEAALLAKESGFAHRGPR